MASGHHLQATPGWFFGQLYCQQQLPNNPLSDILLAAMENCISHVPTGLFLMTSKN
jgi:hypothetical protein